MQSIQITKFRPADGAPNVMGRRIIGSFNVNTGGINIIGCLLFEDAEGFAFIGTQRGVSAAGTAFGTQFMDHQLRDAICHRVAALYLGTVGRELNVRPAKPVAPYGGKALPL